MYDSSGEKAVFIINVDIVNGPNKFLTIDAYIQIDHYIACMKMLLYRQIGNLTGDRRGPRGFEDLGRMAIYFQGAREH